MILRFESHTPTNYVVYACDRYEVTTEPAEPPQHDDQMNVRARRAVYMFRSLLDENPYYQTVGALEPYGRCYVMNDAGKTIDTIR